MNPQIFREYDIRGEADRDLSDDLVRHIGLAFGTFVGRRGARKIAVGRDCRLSSDRMRDALVEGVASTGVDVVDLGVVPTPLTYFSVFHWDLDGAVQITGSHNPPGDNGFKMMRGRDSLYGQDIQRMRMLIETEDYERGRQGRVERRDVGPAYLAFMSGNIRLAHSDLRLAIDAGNGAGGPIALEAFRQVGLRPHALLCEMDGAFPVHHPDPTEPANLELLRREVVERNLDAGIALDGDADRLGVIDERGEIIWGDRLLVLYARSILRRRPGAAVLGEVKCSQVMYDEIERLGGRPIVSKTGHSLIKARMKEDEAILAGEMSGHVFFADRYFGFDDAVYAALRLAEILAAETRPLSELLADLPETHVTPEIRVPCPDTEKFEVVDRVLSHFKDRRKVVDIDGARILYDSGWGLVRASNTQPVLVMRFEGTTPQVRDAIREEVESAVRAARGQ